VAPLGARGRRDWRCVRPTSALRNRSNSSTRASHLPSAAVSDFHEAPFDAPRRPPSFRALRLVPSRATVFFARCFARPETGERGTGWLGPPDARRGWGESRFTTRIPLRWAMGERAEAYCSSARHRTRHLWHPCRLLRARVEGRFHDPSLSLEGRQDRFRGGPVKGVRFPDPRCLPPAVATRIPPRRSADETTQPSSIARRSRDEDRRPSKNRPPFAASGDSALTRFARNPRSGSRPRASYAARAFDPFGAGGELL